MVDPPPLPPTDTSDPPGLSGALLPPLIVSVAEESITEPVAPPIKEPEAPPRLNIITSPRCGLVALESANKVGRCIKIIEQSYIYIYN